MISKELAKKIKYMEIYTSKAVNDVLAGEYESVFKGRGMEFDEVREYQPGDEVRDIDWNVTARTGHPYIKRFVEERELTVMFMVDLSASGSFGSVKKMKNEIAAELCSLLAFSAIKNNDKVGLIIFTDKIELFVPPGKGSSHVLRIIRELLSFTPENRQTNISSALNYIGRILHKRSVLFLVSDFIDKGYEKNLRIISRRHDLIAISLSDPLEENLPKNGLIQFQDSETNQIRLIDTSSAKIRKAFKTNALQRKHELAESFLAMSVDQIPVSSNGDYLQNLITFFKKRERRLQMG